MGCKSLGVAREAAIHEVVANVLDTVVQLEGNVHGLERRTVVQVVPLVWLHLIVVDGPLRGAVAPGGSLLPVFSAGLEKLYEEEGKKMPGLRDGQGKAATREWGIFGAADLPPPPRRCGPSAAVERVFDDSESPAGRAWGGSVVRCGLCI